MRRARNAAAEDSSQNSHMRRKRSPYICALANGDYTVDHSAAIFLVDPNGALRALFSTPHSPAIIAADYRRIVDGGSVPATVSKSND